MEVHTLDLEAAGKLTKEEMVAEISRQVRQWKKKSNARTAQIIADEILVEITNDVAICGVGSASLPRLVMLTREIERNPEAKAALTLLADIVLRLFPNKEDGDKKQEDGGL